MTSQGDGRDRDISLSLFAPAPAGDVPRGFPLAGFRIALLGEDDRNRASFGLGRQGLSGLLAELPPLARRVHSSAIPSIIERPPPLSRVLSFIPVATIPWGQETLGSQS